MTTSMRGHSSGSSQGQTGPSGHSASPGGDPNKWQAVWLGLLFALTLPITLWFVIAAQTGSQAASAAGVEGSSKSMSLGQLVYGSSCAVCHGPTGDGIPRLGKPLHNSAFVQSSTDDELFQLVAIGRLPTDAANTTGAAMPPRADKQLSDAEIHKVISYLRTLQDPSQPTASLDAWILPPADTSGGGDAGGNSILGHDVYVASCSACHGLNGEGMEGLGKPFTTSEFIKSKTDKELTTFIKTGRPMWDAENTTGVDMPPKGGNPALNDDQITEIISYLRAINKL